MEYQPHSPYAGTAVGTVSNVNIFLNTLQFKDSPTGVMMLHAAKPTSNLESWVCTWCVCMLQMPRMHYPLPHLPTR
jgi:hypothetical protein